MTDVKFEDILKNIENNNNLWFSVPLSAYFSETKWIYNNQGLLVDAVAKDKSFLMPYMINSCRVFGKIDKSLRVGDGIISSFLLRGFLERTALISYGLNHTEEEFKSVMGHFMSDDTGRRQSSTDTFLQHLKTIFPSSKDIYNLLSRYFSHISYVETFSSQIKVSENFADDYIAPDKNMHYGYLLYVVVIFDVINLYARLIESHVECKSERAYIAKGLTAKHENMIFICKSLFGGYFSRNNPLKISILLKNVKNMNGNIGITYVYKNCMRFVWFGNGSPPDYEILKEVAVYIIGENPNYKEHLKIYSRKENSDNIEYELQWDKSLQYNRTAILFASANEKEPIDDRFFDYIDTFMKSLSKMETQA